VDFNGTGPGIYGQERIELLQFVPMAAIGERVGFAAIGAIRHAYRPSVSIHASKTPTPTRANLMPDKETETSEQRRAPSSKTPYEAPRILYKEALEAGAFICGQPPIGKTSPVACPTATQISS
jgi:hypothetical protein